MSNTAQKIQFVPRSGLQRTLDTPPGLKPLYYAVMIWVGLWLALNIEVMMSFLPSAGLSPGRALFYLADSLVIVGLMVAYLRPAVFSTVDLFNDKLVIRRFGKRTEVQFADIDRIEWIGPRGIWFSLVVGKQKYRFITLLRRQEYILENIAAVKPELISMEKLAWFRMVSVLRSHQIRDIESKDIVYKYIVSPFVGAAVIASAVALRNQDFLQSFASLAIYIFKGQIVLACFAGMISNAIIVAKTKAILKENPNYLGRGAKFPNEIENFSQRLQLGILVCTVCFITLMMLF